MRRSKRAEREHRGPVPMGEALQGLFDRLHITPVIKQYDALREWSAIVGAQIARVTKAERIENGVLIVSVTSAPWRSELTMKKREILARVNEALGGKVLKDIRFR